MTTATANSSRAVIDAAIAYAARGWRVVPVHSRGKIPIGDGWQRRDLGEFELEFGGGRNIGVILGAESGGLVDVDLDCPEAIAAAPHLLPATDAVFGRAGARHSHRLYAVPMDAPLPRRRQWDGPDIGRVVELRISGDKAMQTVFPPSTHESGEPISWASEGEPASIAMAALHDAVSRVAAAAVLAHKWPSHARHDASLALAGGLLRAGWSKDEIASFVLAVCDGADDEETDDRLQAVDDSAKTLASDGKATGWPKLIELIGQDVVRCVREWLGVRASDKDRADPNDDEKRPKQADVLVDLAHERYRFGVTEGGEVFAVEHNGPNFARMLRGSRSLRGALAAAYRREVGSVPSASALADAMCALEGEAADLPPEAVHLRVARHDGKIVLDLGDKSGRCVIVSPSGWTVEDTSPVLFRRTGLTGALPEPERGGSIDDLRATLNVTDETWPLVVGWLVCAMMPDTPCPILLLGGQHGTGKSTAARNIVRAIDPSPAPLRTPPRDVEAWCVSASSSRVVALDNISSIPGWLSDALCRASTGDGLVRRKLYSDSDLAVLTFQRAVMLTSIDTGALRGDLGDRLMIADLEPIADGDRQAEADLEDAYRGAWPGVLGAVLDLLASVLAALPVVEVPTLGRMADAERTLAALDRVAGLGALDSHRAQAGRIAEDVVESDPVAVAVQRLVEDRGEWAGTSEELLKAITPENPPKGWPAGGRALSGKLRRAAPSLQAVGVTVRPPKRTDRPRRFTITLTPERETAHATVGTDGPTETPAPGPTKRNPAPSVGRRSDGQAGRATGRPTDQNRPPRVHSPDCGRSDGPDGLMHNTSANAPEASCSDEPEPATGRRDQEAGAIYTTGDVPVAFAGRPVDIHGQIER